MIDVTPLTPPCLTDQLSMELAYGILYGGGRSPSPPQVLLLHLKFLSKTQANYARPVDHKTLQGADTDFSTLQGSLIEQIIGK